MKRHHGVSPFPYHCISSRVIVCSILLAGLFLYPTYFYVLPRANCRGTTSAWFHENGIQILPDPDERLGSTGRAL